MRRGRLRHRISLERPVFDNDGGTQVPRDPEVVASRIPAEVTTATSGRLEQVFAGQVQANVSHIISTRASRRWSVRHSDEVLWHDGETDRRLQIQGVAQPDTRRVELLLAVSERRP